MTNSGKQLLHLFIDFCTPVERQMCYGLVRRLSLVPPITSNLFKIIELNSISISLDGVSLTFFITAVSKVTNQGQCSNMVFACLDHNFCSSQDNIMKLDMSL